MNNKIENILNRKIIQGNCGWSDESLFSCHRVFPLDIKDSKGKLRFLSNQTHFGCIEIDSTSYAIPSLQSVQSWIDATPSSQSGFKLHFKLFSLLCNNSISIQHLPLDVRKEISNNLSKVTMEILSKSTKDLLWKRFNDAIEPAFLAEKLGYVIVQFFQNFLPCQQSFDYLNYCVNCIDHRYKLAIDFRNRDWINDCNYEKTIKLLKSLRPEGVVLVASDDLMNEMNPFNENLQSNKTKLSIRLTSLCASHGAYIRIHRRQGNHRFLSHIEIQEWIDRIRIMLDERVDTSHFSLQGPVYVLWATDWEDQPLINAKSLYELTSLQDPHMIINWIEHVSKFTSQPKIQFFFSKNNKLSHDDVLISPSKKKKINKTSDMNLLNYFSKQTIQKEI